MRYRSAAVLLCVLATACSTGDGGGRPLQATAPIQGDFGVAEASAGTSSCTGAIAGAVDWPVVHDVCIVEWWSFDVSGNGFEGEIHCAGPGHVGTISGIVSADEIAGTAVVQRDGRSLRIGFEGIANEAGTDIVVTLRSMTADGLDGHCTLEGARLVLRREILADPMDVFAEMEIGYSPRWTACWPSDGFTRDARLSALGVSELFHATDVYGEPCRMFRGDLAGGRFLATDSSTAMVAGTDCLLDVTEEYDLRLDARTASGSGTYRVTMRSIGGSCDESFPCEQRYALILAGCRGCASECPWPAASAEAGDGDPGPGWLRSDPAAASRPGREIVPDGYETVAGSR